jgi:hypothetical protein
LFPGQRRRGAKRHAKAQCDRSLKHFHDVLLRAANP